MARTKRKKKKSENQTPPEQAQPDPEVVATKAVVRSKPYVIGLVVILVVVAVWALLRERRDRINDAASAAAYAELAEIRKGLDKATEKRRELIYRKLQFQNQIDQFSNYPGQDEQRGRLADMFADQIAKTDKELAAATKTYKEKVRKSQGKMEQLIKDHAGTGAAKDAKFYLAQAEYQLGNYSEAATRYRDFAAAHPDRMPLTALAQFGAADSLIAQGKLDEAYKILKDAAKPLAGSSEQMQARASYRAAFCAALQGKYDVAEANLNTVLAGKGTSQPLRDNAERLKDMMKITSPEDFKVLASGLPAPKQPEKTPEKEPAAETPEKTPAKEPAAETPEKTPAKEPAAETPEKTPAKEPAAETPEAETDAAPRAETPAPEPAAE